jgi:hypothetical protein
MRGPTVEILLKEAKKTVQTCLASCLMMSRYIKGIMNQLCLVV